MDYALFGIGISLLVLAVVFAIISASNPIFTIVFGGVGVIDILSFFLKDPPKSIQTSRANLTKLEAAYYYWLVDATNWEYVSVE